MNANAINVLNYLKTQYPNEVTKEDIVSATELTGAKVQAALTGFGGLARNELLVSRSETEEIEPAIPATDTYRGRKAKMKTTYFYVLNEDGLAYDPTDF